MILGAAKQYSMAPSLGNGSHIRTTLWGTLHDQKCCLSPDYLVLGCRVCMNSESFTSATSSCFESLRRIRVVMQNLGVYIFNFSKIWVIGWLGKKYDDYWRKTQIWRGRGGKTEKGIFSLYFGEKISFWKWGEGQKYHILGKYTPLAKFWFLMLSREKLSALGTRYHSFTWVNFSSFQIQKINSALCLIPCVVSS